MSPLNNEQARGTCQGVRGSGKGQGQGDVETPSNASKKPTVAIPISLNQSRGAQSWQPCQTMAFPPQSPQPTWQPLAKYLAKYNKV
jgi:hypothetical protein